MKKTAKSISLPMNNVLKIASDPVFFYRVTYVGQEVHNALIGSSVQKPLASIFSSDSIWQRNYGRHVAMCEKRRLSPLQTSVFCTYLIVEHLSSQFITLNTCLKLTGVRVISFPINCIIEIYCYSFFLVIAARPVLQHIPAVA